MTHNSLIRSHFRRRAPRIQGDLRETPMCDKNHTSSTVIFSAVRTLLTWLTVFAVNAAAADPIDFDELVIDAGFYIEQPVLFASLSGDERHVVLGGRDDEFAQRIAVFSLRNTAEPLLNLRPGPDLIAYDTGRIDGRDYLFFIEPGRITRLDISTGELIEFAKVRSIYGQRRTGQITPIDFIRDVSGDELDDLVVPDTAGYRVRLQREDGTLGEEVVLEDSSAMTVSGGTVSFESRPLVSGNMTDDDLPDLAVWRGNTLRVYEQKADHRFNGEPFVITLNLGLQSEAEMRAIETGRGAMDQSGLTETRIWRVEDLNGDNQPDILTESLLNKGVFDKENDFRLHLGRLEGEQISFHNAEDALLASSGLQYGLITTDIDGDGRKDLLVRKVHLSFGRVIRALLSGNVSLQLHFFRMTDADTYAEEANYITKTNVQFSVSSGQVDIPAIKVADFDADGLQDLMMQTDTNQLSFQNGVRGDELFSEQASERTVALPRNGDLATTDDINDDGRADLVIRYNAADGDGPSRTVRLLISTP